MVVSTITLRHGARARRRRHARARGDSRVGELMVVIAYLGAVYGPLSSIAHTTGQLQGAIAGARRVRKIFALCRRLSTRRMRSTPRDRRARSASRTSSFSYPDGPPVLHDISFNARPGEMVALVGLTGAGKTTLVSLIPRFYEPTAGRVLIDGVDVRAVPAALAARADRDRAAGRRCSSPARSPTTCATAGSTPPTTRSRRRRGPRTRTSSSSRLPKGYDTPVAEAGGSLSGGERQRLERRARAAEERADPDPRRADLVARRDLGGDRVRGAAAPARGPDDDRHRARLSTVRDADRILVLRRRAHRGAGHARRAADVESAVPADVRAARRSASRSTSRRRSTSAGSRRI